MRQNVHNVSYLACYTINLKEAKGKEFECVALPLGAEVVHLNLNVDETCDVGLTADVGLNEEKELFLNDVALDSSTPHTSAKNIKVENRGAINLTLSSEATKGKVTLRVIYYLPSTIKTEY